MLEGVLEEVVGGDTLAAVGFGDRVVEAKGVAGVNLVEWLEPGVGL